MKHSKVSTGQPFSDTFPIQMV